MSLSPGTARSVQPLQARPLVARLAGLAVAFGLLLAVQALLLLRTLLVAGLIPPDALPDRLLGALALARELQWLAVLLASLAFLAWLARAYGNLGPLGAAPRWSLRQAIGCWFIPGLNCTRALKVLDEVRLPDQEPRRGRLALRLWWGCWLLLNTVLPVILLAVVLFLDPTAPRAEIERAFLRSPPLLAFALACQLAALLLCACTLVYAAEVGRAQRARAYLRPTTIE